MDIIDPHLHLFDLQQGHYDWLDPQRPPYWPDKAKIRRNFHETDLILPEIHHLKGFVHIEAGFDNAQPQRELDWLTQHCRLPFRAIAYADMLSETLPQQLALLQQYPAFAGVRYILEAQAEVLLANPTFQQNLLLLAQHKLIFEVQFALEQRPAVELLCHQLDKLPDLKVVINHAGLPAELSQNWMDAITALAYFPECYIKCSGWEMAARGWSLEQVKPYIDYLTRQFGFTRVMLASNFPVSELGCSYAELWQRYLQKLKLKSFEKTLLVHDNAERFYSLQLPE